MMTVVGVGDVVVVVGKRSRAVVVAVFVGRSKLSTVFVGTAAAAEEELVDVASSAGAVVASTGLLMADAIDVTADVAAPPRTPWAVVVVAGAAPPTSVL